MLNHTQANPQLSHSNMIISLLRYSLISPSSFIDQARINAVYKQATLGDSKDTKWETPFQQRVTKIWCTYKGTPQLMAKRRFLTLLRDVDPSLLQIKDYHFVPWGFPTSAKGVRICPYSNTKKGCSRPLIDKCGNHLENELENNERLSDLARLQEWLDEAASQQRCSLGLHVPISKDMGAKFADFFARPECGGFQPYMPKMFHEIVKKVQRVSCEKLDVYKRQGMMGFASVRPFLLCTSGCARHSHHY